MKPTKSIGTDPRFKKLTAQQGAVAVCPDRTVKVQAPAGSGKTTVMMSYAAARPMARGLYLAFGKPTQLEAKAKLDALSVSTRALTGHSLAFGHFGAMLERAGKLRSPNMRSAVTANLLGVNYPMVTAINETLKLFMCSADDKICEQHLPKEDDFPIVKLQPGHVIEGARKLWARMVNISDPEVQATHDVYLKQWAMTKPKLDFDFILFDECQDANPLMAALVNGQQHCTRVYVGDPHQSIYGFRGATNLMSELQAETNLYLTQSFRFTHNIGLMASTFLRHWKGETRPIVGKGVGGRVTADDQQAYLSRTVAGLIAKGFELHSKGNRIHWVKGFEDYRVGPIMDAHKLFANDRSGINDPVLKLMGSWSQFEAYVETSGDGDAGPVYRLVEEYQGEIPAMVESLRNNQVKDAKDAPYVLTTAHKSKGLEWPVVRLVNDFFSFKEDKGKKNKWKDPGSIDEQEANLMYVALTRAQKAIGPTSEMREWFRTQPETAHLFPEKPKTPAETPSHDLPRAA